MNVLITGGTGLVGSHVAVKCLQEGYGVIVYDNRPKALDYLEDRFDRLTIVKGDVTDIRTLMQTVKLHDVEGIIHTAAMPNDSRITNIYNRSS